MRRLGGRDRWVRCLSAMRVAAARTWLLVLTGLIDFDNGPVAKKAVYKNIRDGFDGNLRDYMDENVVAHAFHHNALLVVSNGDNARYGSITGEWEHFNE